MVLIYLVGKSRKLGIHSLEESWISPNHLNNTSLEERIELCWLKGQRLGIWAVVCRKPYSGANLLGRCTLHHPIGGANFGGGIFRDVKIKTEARPVISSA